VAASNPMVFGPALFARPASIAMRGLATLGFYADDADNAPMPWIRPRSSPADRRR